MVLGYQQSTAKPESTTVSREPLRQAVARVGRFLGDLPLRWDRQRVLVIGHVATRWGLDHFIGGVPLEDLMAEDFAWQEGWEYRLPSFHAPRIRPADVP